MLPASVPGKMVHLERSHLRFELGNHGLELGEASFMGFLGFDEELILREPHQVSPKTGGLSPKRSRFQNVQPVRR